MDDERKRRGLTLQSDDPNKTSGEVLAEKVFQNGVNSAVLIAEHIGGIYGDTAGLNDWMMALRETTSAVQGGDLKDVEAMLTGQALALDAIFTNMARKAILNDRVDQLELCMKLALKAQSQSRATLEALAAIKNPQQTVFMKQANIAHGPQQVNNGPIATGHSIAEKAQKKTNSLKNKLLRADEKGERLDTGTAGKAGCCDPELEAVGAVNRPQNRVRQGQCLKERG